MDDDFKNAPSLHTEMRHFTILNIRFVVLFLKLIRAAEQIIVMESDY